MAQPSNHSLPTQSWKDDFISKLSPFVLRGDYKSAVAIARTALREYPSEFLCRYQYAKLLGDWADELPVARRKKFKREAISILRPLLRSLRGQPMKDRFGACINYYYQSEAFKDMFSFGRRFVRTDKEKGYYAQGLGAVLYAQTLYDSGATSRARSWAKKSVAAWKRYPLRREKYYFAHYSYAKALALSGNRKASLASLKTAARLGKRKITDWEFADVLKLIEAK